MKLVTLCLTLMIIVARDTRARRETDDDEDAHGTVRILSSSTSLKNSSTSLNWFHSQRKSGFSRGGGLAGPGLGPPLNGVTSLPPFGSSVIQDGANAGEDVCNWDTEEACTWSGEKDGFVVSNGKNVSDAKKLNPETLSGPETDAKNQLEGLFLYVRGIGSSQKAHLQIYSGKRNATLQAARCAIKFNFHAKNILEGKVTLFYEVVRTKFSAEIGTISKAANDSWILVSFHVGKISEPFQLILEVWTIQNQPYHAAFDDIQLINCTPPPSSFPRSPKDPDSSLSISNVSCVESNAQRSYECSPGVCISNSKVCDIDVDCEGANDELEMCGEVTKWGAYCNFENGPCGWYNDSTNDLSWVLTSRHANLVDHTLNNTTGTFMYLMLSKRKDLGHRGILRSATFPPPPKNHSNVNSTLYGSCQIRFYCIVSGQGVGDLVLNSVELIPGMSGGNVTKLWRSEYRKQFTSWKRITLSLPPITHRYYLQFVGHQGLGLHSDIAVDDFTLSPECFNPGYKFTTCGAAGRMGPTQELCDQSYKASGLKVDVGSGDIMKGIQKFTVLESGVYSVTAKGAGGGQGLRNRRPSKGDVIYGVFNWTQGEVIYILVGQQGQSACNSESIERSSKVRKLCSEIRSKKKRSKRDINILKNALKVVPPPNSGEGGGGGGGATYIFKLNDATGTYVPLLVAAGGGGLAAVIQDGSMNPDGKGFSKSLSGMNGRSSSNGTGAGGGWNDTNKLSLHSGLSLALGSTGGKPCKEKDWVTNGGFGGGGGGCSAGGGGGGYTGGDASTNDSIGENGSGGYSYSSSLQVSTFLPSVALASRSTGNGSVDIFPSFVGCGCEYQCVVFDVEGVLHSCICPDNQKLDEDGRSCNAALGVTMTSSGPSFFTQHVMTILPIVLIIALAIATGMFILYHRYRRHAALQAQRPECPYVRDSSELQLNRLRQNAAGRVTEYNPNYEFGGSMCTIQDLKEINRENLTLVKALGQGAFGEVYQGYLSNVPGEITDIPVAIKTLPELCSDQAEMDFLMEALIMSKFTNPNIVKFIGVCFEKLPKFIVLELLPGGDLKSFLRESRRKPEKPSVLTMRDLLMMAMDVAKGCQYLEENHFIHRDIAARNCLLTSRDVTRVVKIADFGMARDIYRADYYRKGGKAMLPVKWMPPEAFMDGIFTSKTDVWSFGVLLWEVMSLGFMPYPGRGNQEVMQLVTSGGRLEPPPNCPGPVHQIMVQCWHSSPDERPNFSTILERLGYCLQDPHVTNAPLPVFHRPPSTERDTTIMRPPDSDVCLQVHRNDMKEPQSPSSNDYLVPIPSNYSLCTEKTELQSASSLESVDRILEMDTDRGGGPEGASCREPLVERMPSPLKPQTVPIYTGLNNWETSFTKDKTNVSKLAANWAGYQSVPTQDVDQLKSNSVGGAVPRVPLATIPPPECSPARKSPPSAIARQRPNYSKKSSVPNSTFSATELSLDAGNLQKQQPPLTVSQLHNYPTQVVSYANVAVSNSEPVRTTPSAVSPPAYIYGGANAVAPALAKASVVSKQDKH